MNEIEILDALPGRGGKRPGAGAKKGNQNWKGRAAVEADASVDKPPSENSNDSYVEYSKARARSEAAKADLAELDYKVKSAQYVSRAAVKQACATAFSTIAQVVRSIPDYLERSAGITPAAAQAASLTCDAALLDLSNALEMLSGPDE